MSAYSFVCFFHVCHVYFQCRVSVCLYFRKFFFCNGFKNLFSLISSLGEEGQLIHVLILYHIASISIIFFSIFYPSIPCKKVSSCHLSLSIMQHPLCSFVFPYSLVCISEIIYFIYNSFLSHAAAFF